MVEVGRDFLPTFSSAEKVGRLQDETSMFFEENGPGRSGSPGTTGDSKERSETVRFMESTDT